MSAQILPVTSDPNQTFTCVLNIKEENKRYKFIFRFNEIAQYWVMEMIDDDGNNLVAGLPLVPGEYPAANILEQYSYLGIGDAYLINTAGTDEQYPSEDTLGEDWKLVWYE